MASHGTHQIVRQDNILLVKLIGSFNETGVHAYVDAVKKHIAAIHGKGFAMLINDTEVDGGTPEAYQVLNDYNNWLNSQPVIAKAFVLESLALKHIILARTPALKKQNIEFFADDNSAIAWLKTQLEE
ncbi:hypothetical protein [Thalassotalea sediminis]|uniref:hypothetical protein n=1 Tax=Thalassotalea sediminis TaxID=1759089 RepID=UPI00257421E3|nr:hypothetical protein [Thalassotalea sediminis]